MPGMSAPTLPALPSAVARAISLIVIHCTATPSGRWLAGAPGRPDRRPPQAVIDDWHRVRGFKRSDAARTRLNPAFTSIGYHFVVDLDGSIGTGRHLEEIGAHAVGFNAASVGISLVGGAERVGQYTPAQWTSLGVLVQTLAARLNVPLLPIGRMPPRGICGHRDLSPDANANGSVEPSEWLKTCPGFDVATWLKQGISPSPAHIYSGGVAS